MNFLLNYPTLHNFVNLSQIFLKSSYHKLPYFPCFSEAVVERCSVKKVFLKFRKIHRKKPVPNSFLIKWKAPPSTVFKKWLWHRCLTVNFFEIFKNTVFYKTPPVAASDFCWLAIISYLVSLAFANALTLTDLFFFVSFPHHFVFSATVWVAHLIE